MAEAEGRSFDFLDESHIRTDYLETFPFDEAGQYIKVETEEFSAVCPFSGLPDLGTLTVEYHPDGGCCVELKSFKYYMTSFRNIGLFQEACTARMYHDLRAELKTERLMVTLVYKVRGGMITTTRMGSL